MTAIKKYFLLLLAVTIASLGFGQSSESGIDQTLHESGKIYIVVAVLSVVLIGIIFLYSVS